ncbi:hypothetical protein [Paenibacillus radicis (ex Gao et al. 2016)]|uniref:Uncharacterized protein n=1 Tax=Paenibacillus radicis (ex Gao et al. 2016) TaxID=1737354 RepID=A0A917HMJ6_9BACL|nr:hypothetical protein [Paenibacillus radicis (ex Gao et al. 2016)]GGG83638.1 hypothetical protein GCM10010918_46690 [Paenibacillus radicis (ex Gao et al. 2016)]
MHQSRKEQGMERTARRLIHADRREALIWSQLEGDIEAAEEWAVTPMGTKHDQPSK